MADSSSPQAIDADQTRRKSFYALGFIIAGILLGLIIGCLWGRTMWLASGGPSKQATRLEETIAQKQEFADDHLAESLALQDQAATEPDSTTATQLREQAAKAQAEADRLRSHIPHVQEKLLEVNKLVQQAEEFTDSSASQTATTAYTLIKFCGDLFLQVLKLLVIPLVLTSMIAGITGLGDIRKLGRLGGYTVGYYMLTTGIAVTIGILLVQWIQPGVNADDTFAFLEERVTSKEGTTVLETMLNVVQGRPMSDGSGKRDPSTGMFPTNIFAAASSTNVLALIVFAMVFGGALTTLGEKGKVAIDFFQAANEAVMKMVHLVMLFAPIGIGALVANRIAESGGAEGFQEELFRLSKYVMTVVLGLGIHALVLALALTLITRKNPITYTINVLRALLTAMSTASSSATLPVTIECVEENNNVSNRSAGFVLPLGATINMDGTALYEAVAVIFIAQSVGMELAFATLLVIFFTATLAAIGAAGIPEAGLVTMVIVVQAAGIPMSGMATILAIDWFLDRMRTTVNVYGDSVGAGIIDHIAAEPDGG